MMVAVCLNACIALEQPYGSYFEFYPRFRELVQLLQKHGGMNAAPCQNGANWIERLFVIPFSSNPQPIGSEIPVAPEIVDDAAILVEASLDHPNQGHLNTHALSSDFHDMGPNKWFVLELMPSNLFVVIWVFSYDYAKYYQILLFPECSMCPNTAQSACCFRYTKYAGICSTMGVRPRNATMGLQTVGTLGSWTWENSVWNNGSKSRRSW